MGFGSYDESEQRDDSVETDEDAAVSVHESDHHGTVEFEFDTTQESLIERLDEMKGDADPDDA